jgi:fructose-bisphosphate aldolase, class I
MKGNKSSLGKIVKNGRILILAMDQGLEHGPRDFNATNIDPEYVCEIASKGGFTGFALQKGVARHYKENYSGKVPLILKLNGRTEIVPKDDAYSPQVTSVKEAAALGADAVGYTIYVGSPREADMFREFGKIEEEARDFGLPTIVWAYPRGKYISDERTPAVVAYAARVALELGADIVKINYPGSIDAMKWTAACAGRCKVISAGGSKQPDAEFLAKVKDIMAGGASGLAVGRNVWQHENPMKITAELKKIIFG